MGLYPDMSALKYLNEFWRKKKCEVLRFLLRVRCWEFRQLPGLVRLKKPSRLEAAKRMGYKRKQCYIIYRVRVSRGNRRKTVAKGSVSGKPANLGVTKLKPKRNRRGIAESRGGRKCGRLRVLNSYWINQDSMHKYFEVILVDPSHTLIRHDSRINWICGPKQNHRESRGLTSAGREARGL